MNRPVVPGRELDVGQFAEVGHRVDGQVGLARLHPLHLVLHQAEAGRAVDEGRAEDRHAFFDRRSGSALSGFLALPAASHLPISWMNSRLRIGARLQLLADLVDRVVAVLQLFLVDVGVVDAVDVERRAGRGRRRWTAAW